jgi:hypothetical protein
MTPLTKEQRIALLAKARAAKAEKFNQKLEEANKPMIQVPTQVEVTVPSPTEPPTVTTEAPSFIKSEEITLETLDGRILEVCIADICWKGKEITITNEQWQNFVRKGNPDFRYDELVTEVARIMKEGGYIFHKKGNLI